MPPPNGTPLNIYAETAMGDSTWYQVKAQSGNYPQQLGWAYGGNIVVDGDSRPVTPEQPTTPQPRPGLPGRLQTGLPGWPKLPEIQFGL